MGFAAEGAASFGSKVQDTIHYPIARVGGSRAGRIARGGLEGGITGLNRTGRHRAGIAEADLDAAEAAQKVWICPTREPALAAYERAATSAWFRRRAWPARRMVALVLAGAVMEKFGGDSLLETKRNFTGYLEQVKNF